LAGLAALEQDEKRRCERSEQMAGFHGFSFCCAKAPGPIGSRGLLGGGAADDP